MPFCIPLGTTVLNKFVMMHKEGGKDAHFCQKAQTECRLQENPSSSQMSPNLLILEGSGRSLPRAPSGGQGVGSCPGPRCGPTSSFPVSSSPQQPSTPLSAPRRRGPRAGGAPRLRWHLRRKPLLRAEVLLAWFPFH